MSVAVRLGGWLGWVSSSISAAALCLAVGAAARADTPPWQRTETRAPCADFDTLRRPLFGDLHVHTSFSQDAYIRATRVTPQDAYDFARGQTVMLPDLAGASTRPVTLARPLDFTAVTDHAEFFGEVRVCTTPGSPAYGEDLCVRLRETGIDVDRMSQNNSLFSFPAGLPDPPDSHAFCSLPGVDCDGDAVSLWQETQAAAEGAYDRSAACAFTSLIGYEHTAAPLGAHLHRNVIFRNEAVPAFATSYLETKQGGAPEPLWSALESDCLEAGTGCEALTIPHNSNLSGGLRWPDPADADAAARRQAREPLVEIYQHKGASECRFDRLAGLGADTTDELCTFEQDPRQAQGPVFPRPAIEDYPRRNLVRNTLKDGLALEDGLGVNPFRLGFVGGTDTHSGTPGATEEAGWEGHRGGLDADVERRLSTVGFGSEQARFSPGGLTVAWAEENSRDALYSALERRETYATSGTRPVVRFFAGHLGGVVCGRPDFVENAYRRGTPMGGEIGPVQGGGSPRFAVLALKDPGSPGRAGTDLQRVQIVKAWVDGAGQTHERVFDVAGSPDGVAAVDTATCTPIGLGHSELCTVWRDPEFDRGQRALYYARVVENPTCRWSTLACKDAGVDPFSASCDAQAASAGPAFAACCLDEADDPFMEPLIQERAWTSPIWYRPEGVARLGARLGLRDQSDQDHLRLSLTFGRVPGGLDPAAEDLSVRLADDDEIYGVTLPAGALEARNERSWVFVDRSGSQGGVRSARFRINGRGEGKLDLSARRLDLSGADRSDHMIRVEVELGSLQADETRLAKLRGSQLRLGR